MCQHNVNHHWMSWTIKTYPCTYTEMKKSALHELENCSSAAVRSQHLLRLMCILRAARANHCFSGIVSDTPIVVLLLLSHL